MLMFFLMVSVNGAAAPEKTGAPDDHVTIAGCSAPLSGSPTDDRGLRTGESRAADQLQRHLSGMLAQNGAPRAERSPAPAADTAAADESGKPNPTHKWQTVLPILGEEAEAQGHTLPRAFGLMPGFYHGRRHISVSDSQVTIKRMTIPADGLTDIKVKSRELNWSMRLDAWLFPFLNLYGLIGYTREDAYAGVALTPLNQLRRLVGRKPSDLVDLHMKLTGATYGAGFTLVGGYKNFFATYDSNYTISALRGDLPFNNILSPDVKALLNSLRLGWRSRLAGYNLATWFGATYWDTTNTIKGTPRVPVIGKIKFSVREKTSDPWSAHIGTNVEMSESFQLVLDIGSNFSGLFAVAPTLMYRF
jgi:hypothetical protein